MKEVPGHWLEPPTPAQKALLWATCNPHQVHCWPAAIHCLRLRHWVTDWLTWVLTVKTCINVDKWWMGRSTTHKWMYRVGQI